MTGTPEFFNVQPVGTALDALFAQWTPQPRRELRDPRAALGGILASELRAPADLPEFRRSTVDGYAVRAADTFGASGSLPAYLTCVGSVAMGERPALALGPAEAAEIHTGGMLPDGADAVVMIERTQMIGDGELEVLHPVAPGENVIQVGEDVARGALILPAGHQLRPQDIGGLLALGITEIKVAAPPRIGILSCGDELIPPEETTAPGQIRDINAHTLAALVTQAGGAPVLLGIARDTFDDYYAGARAGFDAADVLVLTAGSSVSTRDWTRAVIDALGAPGVLQHGLAVKPGKPTLIGLAQGKPVVGLPGNPVSALLVARQIVTPLIRRLLGAAPRPRMSVQARLTHSIPSATGREDSLPVCLSAGEAGLQAEPIFGKSNLIFTLMRADGLVQVPLNSNGLPAGTLVEVMPFDA